MLFTALKQFRDWLAYADTLPAETQAPAPAAPVVGIEFYNRQATKLLLWIELSCHEVTLEPATEYRIESEETEYRIEFDDEAVILYLQYVFGPKIFKRNATAEIINSAPWELIVDNSGSADSLPSTL